MIVEGARNVSLGDRVDGVEHLGNGPTGAYALLQALMEADQSDARPILAVRRPLVYREAATYPETRMYGTWGPLLEETGVGGVLQPRKFLRYLSGSRVPTVLAFLAFSHSSYGFIVPVIVALNGLFFEYFHEPKDRAFAQKGSLLFNTVTLITGLAVQRFLPGLSSYWIMGSLMMISSIIAHQVWNPIGHRLPTYNRLNTNRFLRAA